MSKKKLAKPVTVLYIKGSSAVYKLKHACLWWYYSAAFCILWACFHIACTLQKTHLRLTCLSKWHVKNTCLCARKTPPMSMWAIILLFCNFWHALWTRWTNLMVCLPLSLLTFVFVVCLCYVFSTFCVVLICIFQSKLQQEESAACWTLLKE